MVIIMIGKKSERELWAENSQRAQEVFDKIDLSNPLVQLIL